MKSFMTTMSVPALVFATVIFIFALISSPVSATTINSASVIYGDEISLYTGTAEFILHSGNTALDATIYIKNRDDPADGYGIPFVVEPDGTLSERLIPGDFTATLPFGNGGKPEIQNFTIEAGYNTRVPFIGRAVSNLFRERSPPTGKDIIPDNPFWIKADFTISPQSGKAPLTITFTDTSTGNVPWSAIWKAGGCTATDEGHGKMFTCTYTNPGTYLVTLKVYNTYANDEITKEIIVYPGCQEG